MLAFLITMGGALALIAAGISLHMYLYAHGAIRSTYPPKTTMISREATSGDVSMDIAMSRGAAVSEMNIYVRRIVTVLLGVLLASGLLAALFLNTLH
jgi:hypothetical protein